MSVRRVCRELLGAWWTVGHAGWRRRGSACTEWRGWPVARRCRPPRDSAPRVRRPPDQFRAASRAAPPPRLQHAPRAAPPCTCSPVTRTHTRALHSAIHFSPTEQTTQAATTKYLFTCQFIVLGCRQIGLYRGNKYPLMGPVALISQLVQGANITTGRN